MKRENPFLEIYKQCNALSNIEKYNKLKNKESCLPLYLDIELTNCCNINCNMCPVGTGIMKRPKGFMSDDVFARVLEDVKKYKVQGVRFIRWGEPTLHKNFLQWGGALKEEGVKVHFNTNGTLVTEKFMTRVIDIGIDSMKFSFQGIDELTYGEMRKGGSYSQLVDKIKMAYEMRGDRDNPYISVTTSTTYESWEDIDKFKKEIGQYCDEVGVGHTKMKYVDVDKMSLNEERRNVYKNFINENSIQMSRVAVCPEIWDKLSINWDGSVSACCADYDNLMVVGNILDNDLKDIFNGIQEWNYREILKKDAYDSLPLCSNCFEYISLKH
jgi:MoaA/NifB/PqqE/SkfB family radical SAM enzyme